MCDRFKVFESFVLSCFHELNDILNVVWKINFFKKKKKSLSQNNGFHFFITCFLITLTKHVICLDVLQIKGFFPRKYIIHN